MKKASVTDAKNNLSALLDGVKGGTSVLIVDRGRPVARLEPVTGHAADEGRLGRLVRDGLVRPGHGHAPKAVFTTPPPKAKAGASALRALIEDWRTGR